MENLRIRDAARANGVYLWEIAARWPLTDSNFSRKLRRRFSPEDERRALEIIDEIRKEAEGNAPNAHNFGSGEAHSGD